MPDFEKNINELSEFYEESALLFSNWQSTLASWQLPTDIVQAVSTEKIATQNRNEAYLKKGLVILMCVLWEELKKFLETDFSSLSRYQIHFPSGYELYHNNDVREIFLVRNCLVHRNGLIDATKDNLLVTSYSYTAGNTIALNDTKIKDFLARMVVAFKIIMT
jgi:hypothetical protein